MPSDTVSSLSAFMSNLRSVEGNTESSKYRFTQNGRFLTELFWETELDNNWTGVQQSLKEDLLSNFALFKEDLSYYIKQVDIPNFTIGGAEIFIGDKYENGNPGIARSIFPDSMLIPQEQILKIVMRDTEYSIIENFILPWMQFNAAPRTRLTNDTNINSHRGVLTATLAFSLLKPIGRANDRTNAYRTYIFHGVYPTDFDTVNLSEESSELIDRTVNFEYSEFRIQNGGFTYNYYNS